MLPADAVVFDRQITPFGAADSELGARLDPGQASVVGTMLSPVSGPLVEPSASPGGMNRGPERSGARTTCAGRVGAAPVAEASAAPVDRRPLGDGAGRIDVDADREPATLNTR